MNAESSSVCCGGIKLIFACSGAADVGAVTDLAARKMHREGDGSMFCLAGVGGRIEPILKKTRAAEKILAIDGCPLNCVKAAMEHAGVSDFSHLQLADLGMEKGQTPANSENIERVVEAGRALL